METRKITVVSTRDQKRTIVETDATTLAELKAALLAANVNYDGMTFYEALTRTELTQDESILPHDVQYKGNTTNELVFMLTNPNKKIKSGALSEARVALYNEIIAGDYAEAVAAKYGKNFTNCSNAELAAFLEELPQNENTCVDTVARATIKKLVEYLNEDSYLCDSEASHILSLLEGASAAVTVNSPYSDSELEELMATMPANIR